jgi:competence protein ComEC
MRRWAYPQLQTCCRLFIVGFLLTHLHVLWQYRALPLHHVAHVLPTDATSRLTLEGSVYRPLEQRRDRHLLYLRLYRLQDADGWHAVTGRIRLSVQAHDLPLLPGDRVRIDRVRLYPTRGFLNPGGFDLRRIMQQQDIYAIGGISNPTRIHILEQPTGLHLGRLIVQWRRRLQALVHTAIRAPYDTVFLGMVLGQRGALPPELEEAFRAAGTAHLLVVSGLHVGFVTMAVLLGCRAGLRLLRSWLPRTWLPTWRPTPLAALLSLPPVLLYCALVGWKVSTLRAVLMIGSYILTLLLERPRRLLHALGLAAALILLLEPQAPIDLGFQLSFLAVAAILLVSRRLGWQPERVHWMHRWKPYLYAAIAASSAAYLATLPIIASAFHTLPTYGILANLVLMPLASVIVPAGVLALGMAAVWPSLASVVFAPLTLLLTWLVALVQSIATLPMAQSHVAALLWPALVGYYGLFISLLWPRRGPWRRACVGLCATALLASLGWQYIETRTDQLRVTFLDVGTGDAIVVQAPGGHNLLIDGGGTYDGRFDIGAQVVAPFLWQHHIRSFDLMALTHMHPNHARGLGSLLRLFTVRQLVTNGSPLHASYLRDLMITGRHQGTQIHMATDGPRQWRWGRLQLTVLSPPATTDPQHGTWNPRAENDRSLVIRLQYGTTRLLLTGDIEHATERWLLTQEVDLRADVLQIPHHGSRTSTLPEFVQRVQPRIGIISLGAANPYGHPHPQVLRTLHHHRVQIFRTDQHGAVTVVSDGTHYRVIPFHPYRPPLPVHVAPTSPPD